MHRRRMLIESDPYETRVAVLEDDRLMEVAVERAARRGMVGNVYKGKVTRVLSGMQAAFVDIGLERDAFLYVDDAVPQAAVDIDVDDDSGPFVSPPIQELVRQGEQILVQVVRDPLPKKGARITKQVALPARFLVLLPETGRVAISRRIDRDSERERLLELVQDLDQRHGLIVRTAGEGRGQNEFREDHRYLQQTWEAIEARFDEAQAPSLLHQDLHPALRVVRDLVDDSFSEIVVQGAETFRRVAGFLDEVQPAYAERVKEWSSKTSLFDHYGLEEQIDAALRSKVWLKSGGYLVIHPTEALVAIDINTGRFTGGVDLEETVYKTNLEAAREVVRQIRLRDLGGIIVVDFIDMETPENQQAVFDLLQAELARDRARSKVLSLSDFGLVEITRKRSRANLERVLTAACPDCQGRGRVKSGATVALEVRREALRERHRFSGRDLLIETHPSVEEALRADDGVVLTELEQELGCRISVKSDATLPREQFEILAL
jgi:ribonuclease G